MDQKLFNQGETIEEFLGHFGDRRAAFDAMMEGFLLDDARKKQLEGLPKNINVQVIAEEWSGDVLYFVPVLFKMAEEAGWNVRIFHRDDHPDMILPYRKDGLYHSVPVFIFYDAEFNELGNWIERPTTATKVIDEENLKQRGRLREANKSEWQEDAFQELAGLVGS